MRACQRHLCCRFIGGELDFKDVGTDLCDKIDDFGDQNGLMTQICTQHLKPLVEPFCPQQFRPTWM